MQSPQTGQSTVRLTVLGTVESASILYRNVLQPARTDVLCAWANQAVVFVLLQHVSRPAGDAAAGEDRREQVSRYSQRVISGRRVEVHVRVQMLLAHHYFFHLHGHLVPLLLSDPLAQLPGHFAEVSRSRIFGVIHAMTETHDLLLLSKRLLQPRLDILDAADLEKILDHAFVSPAVQRAFERANSGDDSRIAIRQRRSGYSSRKRRGVQFVIRVESEGYIHPAS